jgi:hypothetical protein
MQDIALPRKDSQARAETDESSWPASHSSLNLVSTLELFSGFFHFRVYGNR